MGTRLYWGTITCTALHGVIITLAHTLITIRYNHFIVNNIIVHTRQFRMQQHELRTIYN